MQIETIWNVKKNKHIINNKLFFLFKINKEDFKKKNIIFEYLIVLILINLLNELINTKRKKIFNWKKLKDIIKFLLFF